MFVPRPYFSQTAYHLEETGHAETRSQILQTQEKNHAIRKRANLPLFVIC